MCIYGCHASLDIEQTEGVSGDRSADRAAGDAVGVVQGVGSGVDRDRAQDGHTVCKF